MMQWNETFFSFAKRGYTKHNSQRVARTDFKDVWGRICLYHFQISLHIKEDHSLYRQLILPPFQKLSIFI